MRFVGQFVHTLDEKNRLVIPAGLRPGFAGEGKRGVYLTVTSMADGRCLTIQSPEGWERTAARILEMATQREDAERFSWKFGWDSEYVELDGQWRLVIPQRFVEGAGLKREVMVAGVVSSIQVWDMARWRELDTRLGSELPALAKSLYGRSPQGGP